MPFTNDLVRAKEQIGRSRAGGGMGCEDVIGGFREALNFDYRAKTLLIYHIGDMPCNGR